MGGYGVKGGAPSLAPCHTRGSFLLWPLHLQSTPILPPDRAPGLSWPGPWHQEAEQGLQEAPGWALAGSRLLMGSAPQPKCLLLWAGAPGPSWFHKTHVDPNSPAEREAELVASLCPGQSQTAPC